MANLFQVGRDILKVLRRPPEPVPMVLGIILVAVSGVGLAARGPGVLHLGNFFVPLFLVFAVFGLLCIGMNFLPAQGSQDRM